MKRLFLLVCAVMLLASAATLHAAQDSISLKSGYNLISFSVNPDPSGTQEQLGSYGTLQKLWKDEGGFISYNFETQKGLANTLAGNVGYWILANATTNLVVNGTTSTFDYSSVTSEWALVGIGAQADAAALRGVRNTFFGQKRYLQKIYADDGGFINVNYTSAGNPLGKGLLTSVSANEGVWLLSHAQVDSSQLSFSTDPSTIGAGFGVRVYTNGLATNGTNQTIAVTIDSNTPFNITMPASSKDVIVALFKADGTAFYEGLVVSNNAVTLSSSTEQSLAAASIAVAIPSGNTFQAGTPNSTVQLTATYTDESGSAVEGAVVTFSAAAGTLTADNMSATTNSQGVATLDANYTPATAAGTTVVFTAAANGTTGTKTAGIVGSFGEFSVDVAATPTTFNSTGGAIGLTATVKNFAGNAITGNSFTVIFAASNGKLDNSDNITATTTAGVATANATYAPNTGATADTINAWIEGTTSVTNSTSLTIQ